MNMNYIRVCKGVQDKGILVPINTNVYKGIDLNKDYYTSAFMYNDKQYATFKATGTVAGIDDTITDKLYWDFDSEANLDQARLDANVLCARLENEYEIPSKSIALYFSGKKGFQVEVLFDQELFTPSEVKNVCLNIGEGLSTLDRQIYNASRILRLPLSKHQGSGLFKIPLSYEGLGDATIDDIREEAKSSFPVEDLLDLFVPTGSASKAIRELKARSPKIEDKKVNSIAYDVSDVDWGAKPKFLTPEKYLLSLGFFGSGERSHALMILGSTFKSVGFNETQTYHVLKAAAEIQSERSGDTKFSKTEIFKNIISQIFAPHWKGGTYSVTNDDLLKELSLLVPPSAKIGDESDVHGIEETGELFVQYAKDIDKNTLKSGVKCLDDKMHIQVGRLYGIIGPPGSGKCHGVGTKIIMFDGTVKNVEDVKVGDQLMGDDSTARNVLSTTTGQETLYRIMQRNGEDYVVNESHILSLKGSSSEGTRFNHNEVKDIALLDYLKSTKDFKKRMKGYKVAVDFSKKELQIDPYVLGVWLGDGTTSTTTFTIARKDVGILDYLKDWGSSVGLTVELKEYPSASEQIYTVSVTGKNNAFRSFLKQTNLISGKFIPHEYLTSSRSDRLRVLAGLIDTDGYYDAKKNYYEISSSLEGLANDIVFLSRSLGYKTTITKESKHYKSFSKGKLYEGDSIAYRILIIGDNLNDIPVTLDRKRALYQDKQRYQDLTEITVDRLDVGDYYGFEIDGNHRYLLGDFTVTHNTSIGLTILNNTSVLGDHSIFFSYDMSKYDVYQKLIQKHTKKNRDALYKIYKEGTKEEQAVLSTAVTKEYKNVRFVYKTGQTIEEMRNTILSTEKKLGINIRLVIVDYLELVQSKFSDPTQSSAEVIQGLREIAINMNKAVIVFLQPNKMSSTIDLPILSYNAAKGSSAIAQACTAMLTIHRPGYSSRTPENDKFLSIDCVKNRAGPLFSSDMYWDGLTGSIRDLDDVERLHLREVRKAKEEQQSDEDYIKF